MKPPDGRHPPPLGLTRREGIVSDRARNSTRAAISEAARSKVVHFESGRSPDFELRPGATRPIVRIHLLGPMRATTYLGDSILPRGRKARAILGWFCLSAGQRVARGRLASLLWDRVPHAQARASFRQALRELTTNLGPLADELLTGDRETVTFNTALCWIDALAVFATDPLPVSSSRGDLAALCTGELLEELDGTSVSFDQWLLGERTRFADQIRSLFEAEIERISTTTEDTAQLAAIARRLIAFEPTHEGASRVLMRALADSGERAQALREYNRCREALKTALDVEPSSETRALYDAIRAFPGRDDRNRKVPDGGEHNPLAAPPFVSAAGRGRLRVGVLPFLATRSANEENLAFSLSQEIAAALARFRWFDVIAPVSLMRRASSSFMSEALLHRKRLDYVVDGTLIGDGSDFQISVRLLDFSQDARPVWSDRFQLAVGELHRLDELATARIVARIDPVILHIEGQPRRRQSYGATGLLLLAIPLMYSMERKKYEEAGQLIARALEIEPDNAMVAAWAAFWQVFYVGQGWTQDPSRALSTAQRHARTAIRLDPDNAEALGICAHICAFLEKDFDSAVHYFDRALRLNPNVAFIWALSALTHSYIGEPDIALKQLDRYLDLAPFDPYACLFEHAFTIAYTFKGDYEQAVIVGRRVVKANPDFVNGYKPLIVALGHLGRPDEARPYVKKLLAIEPNFTVERFGEVYPFKKASDRDRHMMGLRRAGIPER